MLKPYPGKGMIFWAVDRRVGNVRDDSPELFAPSSEPSRHKALTVQTATIATTPEANMTLTLQLREFLANCIV